MHYKLKILSYLSFLIIITMISCPVVVSAQSGSSAELKTIVIDAGHGGKDPGAKNGKIYEKNITLGIALKLGNLIKEKYPSINVIYTRSNDTFVELYERADIANRNHADLFISIHVNSAANRSARGHETFVMGTEKNNANMEVCQLENSVITLEDDYTSKYSGFDPGNPESYIIFSLLQNSHLEQSLEFATCVQNEADRGPIYNNRGVKQANFLVLWRCTMPAVLIETGFISNSGDMKILNQKSGQNAIALNIFHAFENYKRSYDVKMSLTDTDTVTNTNTCTNTDKDSVVKIEQPTTPATLYGIQILASTKILKQGHPELKGTDAKYFKKGNFYKYYVGRYNSLEEAKKDLSKIRKKFPDAFITKID